MWNRPDHDTRARDPVGDQGVEFDVVERRTLGRVGLTEPPVNLRVSTGTLHLVRQANNVMRSSRTAELRCGDDLTKE